MSAIGFRFRWSWVSAVTSVTVAIVTCFTGCGADREPSGRAEVAESDLAREANGEPAAHRMEVATVGLDMATRSPIVLLRDPRSGRTLPVWVGPAEAQAIVMAMQGIDTPRPMTHDLLVSVLRELDAELIQVRIDDLRDGTYFGKLVLRVGDAEVPRVIDTRPSDGMALAVRTGAPIEVADHVLQAGPDINFTPLHEGEQVVSAAGITVIHPTEERRRLFQLPDAPGVFVLHAIGAADRLGLARGDLIVAVNDETPENPMEFFEAVQAAGPDAVLRIRYFRGQSEHEMELPIETLEPPPPPRERIA
jgi:uncharacterized protein